MQGQFDLILADSKDRQTARLHYVDWLRIIAIFGVFLFHATSVFNTLAFHIKNAEQSEAITVIQAFFFTWGMPLFFFLAGAASWFALNRRMVGQYVRERRDRLLIPFIVGSILLSPIELYLEWSHELQTGVAQGSFLEFLRELPWGLNPRFFGVVGYHLWFLGFLFLYALLTLPLFRWLRGISGQALVSRAARLCERRGGILVFILPLLVVRLGLHPFFPYEHDWADFFFLLSFFILGYLVFSDKRFTQAIWRDWPIMLSIGVAASLALAAISFSTGDIDIQAAPRTLSDFLWWGMIVICSWCWTIFMTSVGMRFLNFSNRLLRYAQEAILPFFVVHQPVIIIIAYFVVQWNAGLVPKLLVVVIGSFVVSLGLYQLIIRRVGVLRAAFGMKAAKPDVTPVSVG